jgi:hypothetical protein
MCIMCNAIKALPPLRRSPCWAPIGAISIVRDSLSTISYRLWAQMVTRYLLYRQEMNSAHKDVSHIAKYDGANFSLWKLGLFVLLEQNDLIDVTDGVFTLPEQIRIPTTYCTS